MTDPNEPLMDLKRKIVRHVARTDVVDMQRQVRQVLESLPLFDVVLFSRIHYTLDTGEPIPSLQHLLASAERAGDVGHLRRLYETRFGTKDEALDTPVFKARLIFLRETLAHALQEYPEPNL
jgi:hypothetical protein